MLQWWGVMPRYLLAEGFHPNFSPEPSIVIAKRRADFEFPLTPVELTTLTYP